MCQIFERALIGRNEPDKHIIMEVLSVSSITQIISYFIVTQIKVTSFLVVKITK